MIRRRFRLVLLSAVFALLSPRAAQPQPPPGGLADRPDVQERDRSSVTVGVEYGTNRFDYHFDNPSSFDGATRVPHDFEQHYDIGQAWVNGRVRYPFAGWMWETEAGFTSAAASVADDYDTFFVPDGNVIVYGTTAATTARSWRAAQTVELGTGPGLRLRVGYTYRRDRSVFHDSFSTTTQTRPASMTSFWNTGRETTTSELHQVRIGIGDYVRVAPSWTVVAVVDLTPAGMGRLTTWLPDKYPTDPDVVFIAKSVMVDASARLEHCGRSVCVDLHASYAGAWGWASGNAFGRRSWAVGAGASYRREARVRK